MHTERFLRSVSWQALSLMVLLPAVAVFPGAAGAQDAGSAAGSGKGSTTQLDRIVITTTNQASVSNPEISGDELVQRRLETIEEVLAETLGVSINSWGGNHLTSVSIRGVGGMYPMSLDDSMVTLSVDGSPVSARHLGLGTLDVESISILKGAQGTAGAAAGAAGTVVIETRKPSQEFSGYVSSEIGTDLQRLVEGAVGGGITETLSGRLALRYSGSDHWVRNSQTGDALSTPQNLAGRGSLLWTGDSTAVQITGEREDSRETPTLLMLKPYAGRPSLDLPSHFFDKVNKVTSRYGLKATHDFSGARFTSATSYTGSSATELLVYDQTLMTALYGSPSIYWTRERAEEHVVNQDFQLSSLPDAGMPWTVGLFGEHAARSFDTCPYGRVCSSFRDFTTDRLGVYGNVTVPVGEKLKVDAGLRYIWSETDFDADYYRTGTLAQDSRTLREDALTGKLGLTYQLLPETEIYARYARGFTPGGFNIFGAQVADGTPYRGAKLNTIEAGFNSSFADGLFSVSGTAFSNWVKDNHLLSYDSATFVVSALNAKTRSYGTELEATWSPASGLSLTAGVAYIDARIETSVFGIGDGDVLAGNTVPDVAPWSFHANASYSLELPDILGLTAPQLNTSISYRYMAERSANPQNSLDLGDYHKLDARAALAHGGTEFYVRGDNLLDQKYDLYGYFAPASGTAYGAAARGRSVFAGFTHKF